MDPNKTIHILSDSVMPMALDHHETQLPVSPTQLLNTDVAIETIKKLDEHDREVEQQVSRWSKQHMTYSKLPMRPWISIFSMHN